MCDRTLLRSERTRSSASWTLTATESSQSTSLLEVRLHFALIETMLNQKHDSLMTFSNGLGPFKTKLGGWPQGRGRVGLGILP